MLRPKEDREEGLINWGVRLNHIPPPGKLSRIHEYGFLRQNSLFSRKGTERDDCLLLVTYRGNGIARNGGRETALSRGMVTLYLYGEDQYYGGSDWEVFWFHFYPSADLLSILGNNAIPHGTTFEKPISDTSLEQMKEIFLYHREQEQLSLHRCAVQVEYVILSSLPLAAVDSGMLRPMRIQDIESYLQHNPVGGYDVESLARLVNLSPSRFSHLFKAEYGVPVHAYVTRIRMNRACRLLFSTNLTIKEIAEELGYITPEHFHTIFKKTFGVTPAEYRKSTLRGH